MDLDVSSWAEVVKRHASKLTDTVGYNETMSQHSQGSNKSTIPSVKSQHKHELETIVDKLSKENEDLKQAQEATLQSQQDLLKANQDLLQQVHIMQTQLANVKEDIRKEFDSKFDTILELFRGPTYAATSQGGNTQSDLGDSPAHKKPDNKTSPTMDRMFPMSTPGNFMEQMHMRNWLMYQLNGAPSYSPTINNPGYPYMMPPVHMNLPQARVDKDEHG